ncbi:HAMP domain-containing sensor histidine kinase [Microseira wollei]|uniref:histidine kinase n=1 Tax=Microseira wollei NIES-4236 TaxID=2530354 RepID=A0AAV3XHL8_9CYAN|nr:PAS domain S-box protein [Microseira wollei]GET39625.1 two-component hybrid sensor and regulator [Microseira wollei NIES-4236]
MTERASLPRRWYQGFANIPIRVLLTVPFMLQLVGAVGIVGYLSAQSGQRSVRELADQLTQQVSLRIHDRLTTYLNTPQDVIAANHLAVQQGTFNFKDFEQLRQEFWQQVTLNPSLQSTFFVNELGELIGYGRFQSEELVKQAERLTGEDLSIGIPYFYRSRSTDPGKRKYYLVDAKGNPRKLAYTVPIDNRTSPVYRYGKAVSQQTWSPISVYKVVPTLGIFALAPIYDPAVKWRGVFASDVTLAGLSTFLNQLKFSPSGQTFIMEHSGNLVATSMPELPFVKSGKGETTRLLAVNSKDTKTRDIARQLAQKFGNFRTLETTQQLTLWSNHQRQFVRVTPYQDRYGLDWLVVVIIPESDFLAKIHANTQRTWLLCGLTLVVAVGTEILTAHWIATPIRRLQEAADAIAIGQLDYPVETSGIGEVAHLTKAFQQMAHQLETSFQALQQSEQRFETLLTNVPIGISVFDATGNQILLNQAGKTILGRGHIPNLRLEQESQTYPIYQAGTDRLYPVEQLPVTRALLGEATWLDDMEIEVNGERVILEVHAIPFFDKAGNVLYAINAFQDITKRRQAEQILTNYSRDLEYQIGERTKELQWSEERFRSAFEDAPIGMALVALEGQFMRVNRSLCEILGYSQDELLTKTFQEITHPDDLAIDLEQVQKMLAGEIHTYQVQKQYLHQRGHVVWVLLSVSLVRDNQEDPIYFIAQIQDISDRYAIEQIKDEFISIVSHELRTPLTAIHGSLGILESGLYSNNSEQFNHLIQIALNNSDRLVRLVNDILDLERLECRKTELAMESCEVTDLIQQAVETVQPIADADHIHLDWKPLPVTVWAAPDAIVQTLTNLLSNAIKFSPTGSTVWVRAEVVEASEEFRENIHTPLPYIIFSIQDQGRGIPADKLETIFGRFQQVDVQDSRRRRGTGLGLAICKSIVQQHQGQIWAQSVLGAGSTFYFTLPVQDEAV